MSMADSDILPAACTWVFPTMGIMQFNKNATERAKEDIKGVLKALNDHLLAKTFLVGERISLADIAVACTLLSLYKQSSMARATKRRRRSPRRSSLPRRSPRRRKRSPLRPLRRKMMACPRSPRLRTP